MTTTVSYPSTTLSPSETGVRELWPWYSVEMLGSCSSTLLTAGIYWYAAKVLYASDSARLWLAASYGYAYVAIAFFAGRFAARWGPRRVGLIAIGGCSIAALLGLLSTRLMGMAGLAIALLLFNLTATTFWPSAETAIAHAPGTLPLSTRTGMYNILWSSTSFLGLFAVGRIFQQGCLLTFFIAAGLSVIGFAILSTFTRPHTDAELTDDPDELAPIPPHPDIARRATRLLHMAWIGNALAYVAIQTLTPLIPTLAQSAHLSTPAQGAAATSVWALTRTIFFVIVLRWTRWHYSVRYLLGFQLLLVITFFMAIRLDHLGLPTPAVLPVFLLSQIGFGAATAFVYSSSLYYAMHVSKGAGGHAGIHEALIGLGVAIGPTIGALAGSGNGHDPMCRVAYSVTAMLVLGTLAMILMSFRTGAAAPPQQG